MGKTYDKDRMEALMDIESVLISIMFRYERIYRDSSLVLRKLDITNSLNKLLALREKFPDEQFKDFNKKLRMFNYELALCRRFYENLMEPYLRLRIVSNEVSEHIEHIKAEMAGYTYKGKKNE